RQRETLRGTVACFKNQLMIVEVKQQLERARIRGDRRRGKPARSEVERDVPPMVDQRREDHADLPHDLGPSVQGLASVAPCGERQVGPGRVRSHARKITRKEVIAGSQLRGRAYSVACGDLSGTAAEKL